MLIQNARLLCPFTGLDRISDIRIQNDLIQEIAPSLIPLPGEPVIDAAGCVAAPGLIDAHVHFRDPGLTWKEDLHTGALAAAAGGFTTVVCMANTKPPVDNTQTLDDILSRAEREPIHILQAACITRNMNGKELTDFAALAAHGACGFTDDGIPLMDEQLTVQAMKQAKHLDLPLSFHEEDPNFITQSGSNETAPGIAEELLTARDCLLSLHTGAVINIQHISSAVSVKLVALAKSLGAPVWAEATPHHFSLTEEALAKHGTLAKMNPPLRTETDRMAIIEGLRDGTIDMIVTDHAPHSREEKERPFAQAPSGIIGLETSLSLGITNLVKPGHLTLMQLMEKMSRNPARLYHLPILGLTPGGAADLVIFDPDEKVCHQSWMSKASNSPFTGTELYGAVKYTICRGQVV